MRTYPHLGIDFRNSLCPRPWTTGKCIPRMPSMHATHIGRVDLNLLPALIALLEERHVSRAALRAGMSQPAMSRALQRLRRTLDDDLLVRTAEGYQITPRGERILDRLASAIPQLEDVFAGADFDPSTTAQVIRLAASDYAQAVLAPGLTRKTAGNRRSTGCSPRTERPGGPD